MSTRLTGTLFSSVDTAGGTVLGSYHGGVSGIACNAAETTAYCSTDPGSSSGAICKINLGAGTGSNLLGTGNFVTSPRGVALSSDESTLYYLLKGGQVYSVPTSGGSGTLVADLSGIGTLWSQLMLDPTNSSRLLASLDAYTGIVAVNLPGGSIVNPFLNFVNNTFTAMCRSFTPNSYYLLLQFNNMANQFSLYVKWLTDQGRHVIVGGDDGAGSTLGSNNDTGIGTTFNVLVADKDGRVYLSTKQPNIYCLDGASLVSITAHQMNHYAGWWLPIANQLVTGDSSVIKVYS